MGRVRLILHVLGLALHQQKIEFMEALLRPISQTPHRIRYSRTHRHDARKVSGNTISIMSLGDGSLKVRRKARLT